MIGFLLDTHTLLWYFQDDQKLSIKARNLLENSENKLYFSMISLWEIAIKINIGKLQLDLTIQQLLEVMEECNIEFISITVPDLKDYQNLPLHHREPFDRILVVQAINHSLILISRDVIFDAYSIQRLW